MRNKTYSKIYIMPAFIIFFTLFLLPSIIGLFYSFTNWNVMNQQIKFIGLDNYKSIFTDKRMFRVFGNTFFYAILTSVLKGFFGLLLALALNREIKSRNYLRTIFFLPMILSNLVVGLVFQQIFHPDTGVLNQFLNLIGIHSNLGWIIDRPKIGYVVMRWN